MGMAASQSRYLGLTARKINVEYEGQQVNQQRTALANESAGLFRQLMGLEVPTAPSQHDYYTDQYVYNDPVNGKTALSEINENEGSDPKTYTVVTSYTANIMQYNSIADNKISLGKDADGNKTIVVGENAVGPFKLSPKQTMNETIATNLNSATGSSTLVNEAGDEYYTFTYANGCTYYINATKNPEFDIDSLGPTQIVDFFTSLQTTEDRTETIENARFSTTSTGRYNTIYWSDKDGNHSYPLTQSQKYDETGYNDAMAKYNHDKEIYEKTVADINAKTKKLEETDRTLELRLKQLDTEQQALQTEMEAVKKVIDKNVENVFKTFQS